MKWNLLSAFIFLLGVIFPLSACVGSLTYSVEPIEARIIDADTKQPLDGVIVVAHWELERGTVGGNVPSGQLKVMESITDKDGKFSFPGFGPETVWDRFLVDRDPRLLLFKSGYAYRVLQNEYNGSLELRTRPIRRSMWTGKVIEMKRFKGTDEKYAEHIYSLDRELEFARYGSMGTLEDCEWKSIPRMLVALHRMGEYFDSKQIKLPGWRVGVRIRKITDVGDQKMCGSAEEVFASYLK